MATTIIVGGGVVGLSTAYHLAKRRFGRVILLDKGPVGDGASSRAAGIANIFSWHREGVLTRAEAFKIYLELSQELDGYAYQRVGYLMFLESGSRAHWEKQCRLYDELGMPYQFLTADEIRSRWPSLQPAGETTGLFDPGGGYSEPDRYIPALAARNRQLGVEIRERQQVTGFLSQGGRVSGVRTTQGDLEADAVVSTVHVWTLQLLQQLNLELPIKAFVHQRYVTQPLAAPVEIPAAGWGETYFRPADGSRILAGMSTPERREYAVGSAEFHMSEVTVQETVQQELRQQVEPVLPCLKQVAWEETRMGLLSYSGDYEPILGPVKQVPGLYVAACFHSNGFAYNPISGRLLAEFVADGKTSINVDLYAPDRFGPEATQRFLAHPLTQGQVVDLRPY